MLVASLHRVAAVVASHCRGFASPRTIPTARSRSSCRSAPAAAPTRWPASSRMAWSSGSASPSSSRTAAASGTTLGATAVARSEPDGYTIMFGTASTFAAAPGLYKRLAYDPTKDFSPIMLLATVPFVLTVNPSLGVNSVQELIALAKSKPGELTLRLGRRRLGASHLLRAVHDHDRHRHEARALSRRRSGHQRRGCRPCAGLFRRRRARGAADQVPASSRRWASPPRRAAATCPTCRR